MKLVTTVPIHEMNLKIIWYKRFTIFIWGPATFACSYNYQLDKWMIGYDHINTSHFSPTVVFLSSILWSVFASSKVNVLVKVIMWLSLPTFIRTEWLDDCAAGYRAICRRKSERFREMWEIHDISFHGLIVKFRKTYKYVFFIHFSGTSYCGYI